MNQHICAATARSRAVKSLLYGAGFALIALACRWALGTEDGSVSRYTPYLFLFSFAFVLAAVWSAFQGLRELLAMGSGNVAQSVRSQLTAEELRLPLKEQFALVDGDLCAHGKALAGGKVLVGRDWIFVKNADRPAMRLASLTAISYRQGDYGALSLVLSGRGGNSLSLDGLNSGELEQVREELQARLSPQADSAG